VEGFDFSYGLYADGLRVASFADGRAGYREWAIRTGRINPSLEDRYDHDVDVDPDVPWAGFYAFGEIGPVEAHNSRNLYTSVVLALS
jgi:hypothetical protein